MSFGQLGTIVLGGGPLAVKYLEEVIGELIGLQTTIQVWWNARDQDSLPAIILRKSSEDRGYQLAGDSGFTYYRFTMELYSRSWPEVVQVSKAIRQALSGYSDTYEGVPVSFFLEDDEDLPRFAGKGQERPVYCRVQSWTVLAND